MVLEAATCVSHLPLMVYLSFVAFGVMLSHEPGHPTPEQPGFIRRDSRIFSLRQICESKQSRYFSTHG